MADSKISDLTAVTDVLATDEYVLARSGATNKIAADDLAAGLVPADTLPGYEIAYVERTTNLTVNGSEASPNTVVSAGAITFDGSTRVCIEFYCAVAQKFTTGSVAVGLWDDTTELAGMAQIFTGASTSQQAPFFARRFLTPSAASHTYIIKAWRTVIDGSITMGTGTGGSATWMPGYIRITRA